MNSELIHLRTIGFTQKSAKEFFEKLRAAGVQRVIDVRLNNASQLAGFSKKNDLEYFLRQILGIDYIHLPILAPTQDILDDFKKHHGDWSVYERRFMELMRGREIEKRVNPSIINSGCLLCSEDKPQHCHRRLVAEYLRQQWGSAVKIEHL
jgi:uncharacterized protein (DUF488 family)